MLAGAIVYLLSPPSPLAGLAQMGTKSELFINLANTVQLVLVITWDNTQMAHMTKPHLVTLLHKQPASAHVGDFPKFFQRSTNHLKTAVGLNVPSTTS